MNDERVQVPEDAEAIRTYGLGPLAEFGGMFHENGMQVVLFTASVSEHEAALRLLLAHPETVEVRVCKRSWQDILEDNNRVAHVLFRDHPHPQVHSAGIGMECGEFVIRVGVHPYTADWPRRFAANWHRSRS